MAEKWMKKIQPLQGQCHITTGMHLVWMAKHTVILPHQNTAGCSWLYSADRQVAFINYDIEYIHKQSILICFKKHTICHGASINTYLQLVNNSDMIRLGFASLPIKLNIDLKSGPVCTVYSCTVSYNWNVFIQNNYNTIWNAIYNTCENTPHIKQKWPSGYWNKIIVRYVYINKRN